MNYHAMLYQAKEYEEKTQFNVMHVQHITVGFQIDRRNNQIPLLWPMVVLHRIDKDSSLYRMDHTQMKASKIEIRPSVASGLSQEAP